MTPAAQHSKAREPAGRSTCRGAEAGATAATAPPVRSCVDKVWRVLAGLKTVTVAGVRMTHATCLESATDRGYLAEEPGREHYALLEWFGKQWPGKALIDIGTYRGASAIALAAVNKSFVLTVDCADCATAALAAVPGISRVIDDAADWLEANPEMIAECPFLLLDASHDGWTERQIYKLLETLGFRGILLLDDINLTQAMRQFWEEITRPKLDLTAIGHHSGTGAVLFEGSM